MEQPAITILNQNRIMTIATVRPDGWPQATIVGYANEGFRLYFLIYRTSQKFANIAHDDRASIAVGHEPLQLSDVKAVYAGCNVHEVTDLPEKESRLDAARRAASQSHGSRAASRRMRWRRWWPSAGMSLCSITAKAWDTRNR